MNYLGNLLNAIKSDRDELLVDFIDEYVSRAYFEYFRYYHTYEEHILPGLELLKSIRDLCKDSNLVELAWWYHDVIYIPTSMHNEQLSADKAYFDCLQLEYRNLVASIVSNLVLATQHFKHEPKTEDEKIIHDMDLAILGSEPKQYQKYVELIRKEYSFVKTDLFLRGRIELLLQFTTKKIYLTPYFQENYEKKAQENIHQEINKMGKKIR